MRTVLTVLRVSVSVCAFSAVLAAEGRTPIYAPGTVITKSGAYVLTRDLSGPGIQINASAVDLDLNGFQIEANGGVAIEILGADDVHIHDGVITNSSVGIDHTGFGIRRVVLEDLRIRGPMIAGIRFDSVNDFTIRRVSISEAVLDGIQINNGFPAFGRIESCHLLGGGGRGIYLFGASSVTIADNSVAYFTGEGINVDSCEGCVVSGNTVTRSGGQGAIYLGGTTFGVTVARNTVHANRSHGIRVANGSRGTVVENNLMDENGAGPAGGDGLRYEGSTGKVVGNTMDANNGVGLYFTSTSFGVSYGRNTVRNNNGTGVVPPCTGAPALFYPESCNDGAANTTFGDNLIPGPALF